ncbi:nitric oxide reductase transcriptional regulator NorR [Vibrio sp. SS-MA-C1-2]|uniref:nitric oxide reductase transcriptional regulator NorR n=1 Tax=Vibrio sp. SS-MA-C1-2 TaxID=2908646 RepID=UPI001F1B5D54|nr:nitric oxide reductase transcriptional regulator NorR [Vibrio sp. SS-MA-C1-2]UJF17392.1 nitric oxide reductase transcriptional regulator NorR [Vibrio sp. SS-MA-C1-2]
MKLSTSRVLLNIALDLSINMPEGEHYQRLIESLQQVFPCDASSLLVFHDNGLLTPVAVSGLPSTVLSAQFDPSEHPRLSAILASKKPVRFPSNSDLPDPFDGLLLTEEQQAIDIHDCMGCSLYVEDQLVGLMTLDAADVGVFDEIDDLTLAFFAALAAATIQNRSMIEALQKANQKQQSINKLLIEEARQKGGEMVGHSPKMLQLRNNIETVSYTNFAVLISGETGTGKELVAHQVHSHSTRSDKPMIYINCAALPESIAESELFGHVKGAFTGATSHRAGKFELADGGTLFLDEIGELPLMLQAKLLRVIQQGEVQRVGSDKHLTVDVRIIAATNRDLLKEIEEGRFRSDLYHRLNVFPIAVPPLRDRVMDITMLSHHIVDKFKQQFNQTQLSLSQNALEALESYSWPGNIRELEHVLMRASLKVIQSGSFVISAFDVNLDDNEQQEHLEVVIEPAQLDMKGAVEQCQKQVIKQALEQSNGIWAQAAKLLKMDRGNLYRLGKKLGL